MASVEVYEEEHLLFTQSTWASRCLGCGQTLSRFGDDPDEALLVAIGHECEESST